MATQPLALTLPLDDPARIAAQGIADRLSEGRPVARNDLLAEMASAFGGSSADGLWSLRDAYDVLELAQVLHLKNATLPADANARLAQLIAMTAALPTQSVRSETQIAFQQFSTPAPIGFLAAKAAAITACDIVLEPSAGTGLLAVDAHLAGARLLLNEIDAWRARLLRHAFPEGRLSTHDGELIDDMLDPQLVPSVVLINPPFSRSQGRGRDRHAALRHLRSALLRLAPGGRCAVILPDRIETGDADWLHATAGAHTPPDANGMHRIRLGERRFRASQLAGLATIPAIVVPVGEGVQLLADQIVENDQRADLSSVELAHAIARMLKGGMNQVEIAAALGRSKQFVSLYAAYGDMPAYLKAALPFAPIRLLYDLHRTARDYPAEVEAYVASWGDAGATLAAGSRFIAELKQTHPAPAPPRAPVAQPLAPTDRDPVRSGLTDKPSAPIRSRLPVLVDGFPAWLPLAPLVTVIFEDGHEREVAASSIGPIGERGEALPTTDPPPPRS